MPYVKINPLAPGRPSSKHGYNMNSAVASEVPPLNIADMIIQLSSHQQVISAEIEQIVIDIAWLEEANKRYADVRIKPQPATTTEGAGDSSRPTSPSRQKRGFDANTTAATQSSTILSPHGAPIANAPPNSVAVACFKKQLRELKLLKDERQAMLKEIRQHLALYQLHAPAGVRLLNKVRKNLGANPE